MKSINGKVVWITGASSGIGEALAYQLQEQDCSLILSARREKELQRVKLACKDPNKVAVLPLDLSDVECMENKLETAISFFGKIDILINNGGISQRSLIAETTFKVYQDLINVNYLGSIYITKTLLPHFISRKQGHFVTITSLMGKFSSPYRSGYCGAKHALHGFFDALRMEHEKDHINVTLICPGFIQTNVAKNALTADGSSQGENDNATSNGIPVSTCAKKIIKAIRQEKHEAYIGKKEIYAVYIKRFFPKLLHKLVLRSAIR